MFLIAHTTLKFWRHSKQWLWMSPRKRASWCLQASSRRCRKCVDFYWRKSYEDGLRVTFKSISKKLSSLSPNVKAGKSSQQNLYKITAIVQTELHSTPINFSQEVAHCLDFIYPYFYFVNTKPKKINGHFFLLEKNMIKPQIHIN